MALIKTPYNLIYNDDGSLCVTLRDDDIPFEGVKSFAVEEGTTNYFIYPLTQEYYGGSLRSARSYYTTNGYKIIATDQPLSGPLPGCQVTATNTEKISISGWTDLSLVRIYIAGYDSTGSNIWPQFLTNVAPDTKGYFSITIDLSSAPSSLAYINVGIGSTSTPSYWIEKIQVEKKSFSTSFVDGTRAEGKTILPFGINKNFVISFWGNWSMQ
ncbi:hypothetical protein [Marinitoga lauensis]|uniref:hypothetical protein n=1 Tax=Marinitoga lauensis TaxID=2201189 RepID=UPI0010113193|nr:hypothetical protein [Marinitoga lauensis]